MRGLFFASKQVVNHCFMKFFIFLTNLLTNLYVINNVTKKLYYENEKNFRINLYFFINPCIM